MNREWISSEHSVSGIYNKNISSEISKAFGVDGKFNKKNQNKIAFIFTLGTRNCAVKINNIIKDENNIRFDIDSNQYK